MVWTVNLKWRAEGMVFVCSDVRRGSNRKADCAWEEWLILCISLSLFFSCFIVGGIMEMYLLFFLESTCGHKFQT